MTIRRSLIGPFQHFKEKIPFGEEESALPSSINARIYTCLTPMAKFNEFRYDLLPHSAYLPDLVPCEYFLFPNLKK